MGASCAALVLAKVLALLRAHK